MLDNINCVWQLEVEIPALSEFMKCVICTQVITRVDLAELIRGQKLKSKRIAYTFLTFNSFVKPSVKTSAVKNDLYLALDKIKNIKL